MSVKRGMLTSLQYRCHSSLTWHQRNYQWGFSFLLLFSMIMMLLFWTFGIVIMWCCTQITMQKRGQHSIAGTHKAVIELAAAMSTELDMDLLDCKFLSEKEIQERITAVQGGCISYNSPLLVEKELSETSLRRWLYLNRWWFLATCALVITTGLMPLSDLLFCFWMVGPTLGMIIALSIGTTPKSRSVFVLVFTILSSVPVVYIAIVVHQGRCLRPFGGYSSTNAFLFYGVYGACKYW